MKTPSRHPESRTHNATSAAGRRAETRAQVGRGRDAATVDDSPRVTAQRKKIEAQFPAVAQRRADPPNRTGMPDDLKAGVEAMSGMDLSDVRVHRNSSRPAQLNALAYTQGDEIHVAPGQERHLPHEAWHVVQQRQGRVRPTLQVGAVPVNDDARLEREADVMGARAMRKGP